MQLPDVEIRFWLYSLCLRHPIQHLYKVKELRIPTMYRSRERRIRKNNLSNILASAIRNFRYVRHSNKVRLRLNKTHTWNYSVNISHSAFYRLNT